MYGSGRLSTRPCVRQRAITTMSDVASPTRGTRYRAQDIGIIASANPRTRITHVPNLHQRNLSASPGRTLGRSSASCAAHDVHEQPRDAPVLAHRNLTSRTHVLLQLHRPGPVIEM